MKPQKFYIFTDKKELKEVLGKPVELVDFIEAFIHKDLKLKDWIITERKTGTMITTGMTQLKAKNTALEIINHVGKEKILKLIDDFIKENGEMSRV